MGKPFWGWVGWFLFLLILDFFIPFVLLKDVPTFAGSFVFWLLWICVAIISMFMMFLPWQENDS